MSSKHISIKKANTAIYASVSIAVFMVIFGLFSAKSLLSQGSYNKLVIKEKKSALKTAKQNVINAKSLEQAYVAFASEPINLLGGNPAGNGPLDGSNPKLTLDSLPSVYDYPALSSSVEKILIDNSYQIERIGGSEDASLSTVVGAAGSAASSGVAVQASTLPSTVTEIPYPLKIQSDVGGVERLLKILEKSIRPFYVDSIELSGNDQSLSAKITMKTFYQPGITYNTSTKVVK